MSDPNIVRQRVLDFCDVIMRDALRGKETLTEGKNILIGAAKKELKILDQHYKKAINTLWEKILNNSSNEKSSNQRAKIPVLTKDMEEIKQMLVELEKNMTAMINACDNNYLSAKSLKEEILSLNNINNINKEQLDRAFSIKKSNQSTEKFADDFDEGYRAFIEAALKKYHKFKAIYDDAATVSVAAASSTPSVAASAPNLSTMMTSANRPGRPRRMGQLASIEEGNENSNRGGTRRRRKRQTKRSKRSKQSKRTCRNRS